MIDMLYDLIKILMIFVVIVIAITPICTRMDIIISKLEIIENSITSEVEYKV